LEYSFQHTSGSLPAQSKHPSQYHTQANAFPSQTELNNKWTKVSYKRGRLTQEETEREAKHTKESAYWLNQTSTSSCYATVPEEESEDQRYKVGPENTPKPPPIYITDIKNITLLVQLLEQIEK
jgi:hypothetical protein